MKYILIIEDEEDIREILNDYLEDFIEGYELHFATNGTEAAIKCHTVSSPYKLIISDQHMLTCPQKICPHFKYNFYNRS